MKKKCAQRSDLVDGLVSLFHMDIPINIYSERSVNHICLHELPFETYTFLDIHALM